MIRIDPFEPGDLAAMRVQPAQAGARDWLALGRANAERGPALTARAPDGRVLLCGGAIEVHPGYATLWAVVSADAGPWMTALTRRVRWFVAKLPHRRVDAFVRVGFSPGCRWAEMLGMRCEAALDGVFEDGATAFVYLWGGRRG